MKTTNTLYAVYRRTPVPDETQPEYNAGYDLDLAGHVIVNDEDPHEPCDMEAFEMRPLGALPKESNIC